MAEKNIFELCVHSESIDDTKKIAETFAKIIEPGDNIFLIGDLGAGKTFFTNCLVHTLGITDFASSPSFKLINEYHSPRFKILHFDLYRLNSTEEIEYLGWDEFMASNDVCVVEWADKAKTIWPEKRFEIRFDYVLDETKKLEQWTEKDFTKRKITITQTGK